MENTLSNDEINRYIGQIRLPELGLQGQEKLKKGSVVVVGAGGLGCPALLYLTCAGIGKMGIIDHDVVQENNLHRQTLYDLGDVGQKKCEVAKKKLKNPHVEIYAEDIRLNKENVARLLSPYDLVIDASDNFETRYAIGDTCRKLSKPLLSGSINHFEGHVVFFKKSHLRDLFPEPFVSSASCHQGGVIGALPGVIGSMLAMEAIKYFAGIKPSLSDKLFILNGLTWETKVFRMVAEEVKPVEIGLDFVEGGSTFIDIREEHERQIIRQKDLWIPYSQLAELIEQVPKDGPVILYCQRGIRSIRAAELLREKYHLNEVCSLEHGFEAFAKK